jgi:hypothetical protein
VNRYSQFTLLVLAVTTYPVANEQHVIVPLLFGYAPEGRPGSRPGSTRDWVCDRVTIVEAASQLGPDAADLVGRLFDLAMTTYALRPAVGKNPGFIAHVRAGSRRVQLFLVEPAVGRVWFIPSGVDQGPEVERPGPFERALRELFGPHVHVGAKAYYFRVPLDAVGPRFDQLCMILQDAATRLSAPGGSTYSPSEIAES